MDSETCTPYAYSGRGMYGNKCLGFNVDDLNTFLSELFYSIDADHVQYPDELAEAFQGMKTDSMGMGMVIYFPHIEFASEDE